MKQSNMYRLSVKQWNPYVGCKHGCSYCPPSFQQQLKRWGKANCLACYQFVPHTHPERLEQRLPRTRYMQFIFCCATGDVAFCPTPFLQLIVDKISANPHKTFLIQSKDPATFSRVKFPDNVILGTTIETDFHHFYDFQHFPKVPIEYSEISKAPHPLERIQAFEKIEHRFKMLTCEPLLSHSTEGMIGLVERINPCMVWLGMDSKPQKNRLPETSLQRLKILHWELSRRGYVVILKTVRKAWWQGWEGTVERRKIGE